MFSRWQKKKKKSDEPSSIESSVEYCFIKSEKRSFVTNSCTLCDELIAAKSDNEKIVELECTHLCHYDCLMLFADSTSLPVCTHCHQYKHKENECVPIEEHIKDRLISKYLLNRQNSLDPPKSQQNFRKTLINRNRPETSSSSASLNIKTSQKPFNYGSSKNGNSVAHYPLPLVRTYFIDWLLNEMISRTPIEPWKLDDSFGLLRLVDIMQVSIDSPNSYTNVICMLFERVLVVISVKDDYMLMQQTTSLDITGFVAKDIRLFSLLLKNQRANTVIGTVMALTTEELSLDYFENTLEENRNCELYLKSCSHKIEIIQKWIVGFLNRGIVFDQDNITSTCSYLPIMKNSKTDNAILGLFRSNKIIEMGSLNNAHQSIIFKRSINVTNLSNNKESIIDTMNTTISSILSLKRERPSNIVMLLQLDVNKILEDGSLSIIINTLKAIKLKYPDFLVVVLNKYMQVQITKLISNLDLGSLGHIANGNENSPLNIKLIKESLFGVNEIDNVAVVAVSNCSMDKNTCCLYSNFRPFVSKGRKRPNELKIKVGYSNNDYSDQINELVEIENWNFLLETLCYSFSLDFDDNDECYDDKSSFGDSESLSDTTSTSAVESITTLDIVSPFIYDRIQI